MRQSKQCRLLGAADSSALMAMAKCSRGAKRGRLGQRRADILSAIII